MRSVIIRGIGSAYWKLYSAAVFQQSYLGFYFPSHFPPTSVAEMAYELCWSCQRLSYLKKECLRQQNLWASSGWGSCPS